MTTASSSRIWPPKARILFPRLKRQLNRRHLVSFNFRFWMKIFFVSRHFLGAEIVKLPCFFSKDCQTAVFLFPDHRYVMPSRRPRRVPSKPIFLPLLASRPLPWIFGVRLFFNNQALVELIWYRKKVLQLKCPPPPRRKLLWSDENVFN